ncbi:hypothetical protein SteCoe_2362 [Stentor coeruleus]|uniref:Uncharacterized protein n=1 Tax=Stentor coeruleus TaxID=5963 RepID=A0A1R2CZL9_9CILI|nr:hypothetical protein SteCoe_2362 [Stentor coeruleus]
MTENYFLTLEKFEGQLDTRQKNIFISIDDNKVGECSLDALPANFPISLPGIITINIHDQNPQSKPSSLSFHSNLISQDWYYWFPISPNTETTLSSLPLNALQPRILLSLLKEIIPLTLELPDAQSSTNPKPPLSNEHPHISDPEILNTKNNVFYENADNERIIQYYQNLVQSLESELKNQKKTSEDNIENYKSQIADLNHKLDQEKQNRLNLEANLLNLNPDQPLKTLKISSLILNQKLNLDRNFKVQSQQNIIIKPQKSLIKHKHSFSFINDSETLERKVNEILMKLKLVGLLKKAKETNFLIGAKTITLCLKKGEVICKNGIPLESYIFKNCSTEIENFLRIRSGTTMRKNASSNSPLNFRKVRVLDTQ